MRKLLLTSAGFDNRKIEEKFLELVNVSANSIKVAFITAAAVTEAQKVVIPLCKKELLEAGIQEDNIVTYNLGHSISLEEILGFHAIYVCGGSTQHLLNKFNEVEFNKTLEGFLQGGGVYLGVSAGSIVLAKNLPNSLSYINCILSVHQKEGTKAGYLDTRECPTVKLTDNQAILIEGDSISIIE